MYLKVLTNTLPSALESRMYNESSAEGAGRLNITIEYVHPESSDDRETLLEGQHFTRTVRGKRQGVRKGEVIPVENNNAVMAEIAKTSKQELMARFGNNMPSVPKSRADSTVQLEREPVYIGGSYCKYSREVSQTPWNEKYGKLELSVQSLIADQIVEVYKPQQVKFMAAGREDVDVRMLGDGRCIGTHRPRTSQALSRAHPQAGKYISRAHMRTRSYNLRTVRSLLIL